MSEYEAGNCVIGEREHRANDGLLVCRGHLDGFGHILREIEDEAIRLSSVPSMQINSDSRGGSLASHRSPARIDVVVLQDRRRGTGIPLTGEPDHVGWDETPSILDVLHSWARVVREERDLASPDHVTITGERDLLTRQLLWICEQPWVDEAYGELRQLLAYMKRANDTIELPVGRCDTLQPSGSLCDGLVWNIVIEHESGPDEPGFQCGKCRRIWTGTEAVRKRDQLWREEQERKATA